MTGTVFARARAVGIALGLFVVSCLALAFTAARANAVSVAPSPNQILISELRFAGPAGADDGYVELYNPGSATVTVTGWKVNYAMPGGSTASVTLPPATIAPSGHLLVADSAYSLGSYAAPDVTTSLGGSPTGVQLTSPDGTVMVDAVGQTGAPTGFFSGTPLTPTSSANGHQTAWVRRYASGAPVNSNNNASDFALIATDASTMKYGQTVEQGAPGPMSLNSEMWDPSLQSFLLDNNPSRNSSCPAGAAAQTCPPNRVVSGRTLTINRLLTNSGSQTLSVARLRITSVTTYGSPGASSSQAILDPESSSSQTYTTSTGNVLVNGITLDQPPSQPNGGGLNSSLSIPIPNGGLAPGKSIPISIDFYIAQGGTFSATWNAEAGLGAAPPPAPTISVSPTQGHPAAAPGSATGLTVSGANWTPGHVITVKIGNGTVCSLTATGSGSISGTQSANGCQVPQVPAGSQPLTASDNSNSASNATGSSFTVQPSIYAADSHNSQSSVESPGDSMDVAGAGFAANSPLTFTLDSTTLTPSGTSKTDGNGVLPYGGTTVTIPAGTSAGTHTLTVSDGTNSASQQITVYAPTVSVTPTSGNPSVANGPNATGLTVSGSGWPAGDNVVVQIAGATVCNLTASGSGNISSTAPGAPTCQVPSAPAGNQALTAYDSALPAVQTTGSAFKIVPAIHVGDANTPSSTTEAPGGTMDVSAAGFAASSQLTIKFDSTTLTPSGNSQTDSTGTVGWGALHFTVPWGASNGQHTITVTDASGNSATQTITVNRVAVAVSPTTGNPQPDFGSGTGLNVSGGGWTPGDSIVVQIDSATVCQLTADSNGNISGTQAANSCQVPRVPAGSQALSAYDSANPGATTQTGSAFTVTPAIHAGDVNNEATSSESPGGKMYVSAAGFAANAQLSFKLDSTTLTPSGTSKTDSTGTLGWGNAQITIPAGTTAGAHTLTVSDGTNSATQQITVYAPTLSVTPTSGNPAPDFGSATGLTVSGGGWPKGDTIEVQIGSGIVCSLTADSSGNISGNQGANGCQVPHVPNGTPSVSAHDTASPGVTATDGTFTVKAAIHVGDANAPSSSTEVPGATMDVSAAGFAASSQLTIKFDSTTLTPSGTSQTDSTGTVGWGALQFTVPGGASNGQHTITVTDASGNSASQTITVNRVAVAVSPTTGNPAPDFGTATGLNVSGGGWTPNDTIVVQIGGATVCDLVADSTGVISGTQAANSCQVPRVPAGSEPLTAYDSANPGVTQTGAPFTVSPAIHAGDINSPSSTSESPGGKMYVSAAGFAASAQLSFKLDSTTLTPSGTSKTDSTGTLGWGSAQITIPAGTTAGAHTLTVTDGTNSASQQITVSTPTLTVTPTSGHPVPDFGSGTGLTVSGSGWPKNDTIVVQIGNGGVCNLTADGSGNISGTQAANGCQVPHVPNGGQPVSAFDSSNPGVTATDGSFTVNAAIHAGDINSPSSTSESPGGKMYVSAAGFAASSQLTIKFDSTTLTPSGTSTTDSSGSVGWGSLQITVPAGASAGQHTITVTDGSNNSASQQITVNRVAVAVSPTTGNPAPDFGTATGLNVSGGGWTPSDYIVVQIGGSTVCGLYADSNGDISGTQAANACQVPRVPAGSEALTAYDSANPGVVQTGAPFTVSPAIHAGDINDGPSASESPGGKMYVAGAGFAASAQLTFKLDSTTLTPSGTSKTDSTGTLGWGNAEITIPAGTTAGAHTVTVSDGTNSASQNITVFTPTVSVTPASGNPAPDYGSATQLTVSGAGWPHGDVIPVQIGGVTMCDLTADGSGNISSAAPGAQPCQVPSVPNGSQALTAFDNSNPGVTATGSPFTVNAAIHVGDATHPTSTTEIPGGTMDVSAAGFAKNSQLTVKFDSTTLTTSGTSTTDSTGTLGWGNLQFTVPDSASAGQHTITVTDGSNNSATQQITVNRVAVAVSPTTGNPPPDYGSATGLTVSGGGWTPGHDIVVQIGGQTVCGLTADSNGNISGTQAVNGCQVPRVPAGSQALTAYDNSNSNITQTGQPFTVTPAIHAGDVNNEATSSESPGGKMYVSAAGFAASAQLSFKLDSTTLTPSGTSKTDSTGTLGWGNAQITIPAGTTAGAHTLTVSDGTNSATQQITVYTPTVSVTPTSGNPAPDYGSATGLTVSGAGWPAGDTTVVQIGNGVVCYLTADGSGNISGTQSANNCLVPRVPNGSQPVSAYDSAYPSVTATDGTFTVNPAIHEGDPNNQNSSTEAPGATVDISGAGFAATKSLSFTFDGNSLASTPSSPSTGSDGTFGWGSVQVTIPSGASAGQHTITAKDANGNSASATVTVQLVAVAVSPTSGSPQPDYGPATGLNVSGAGWTPNDQIVVELGTPSNGAEICQLRADSDGTISGTQALNGCQVPRWPAGSHTLSAYDTANPGVTKTGQPFTIVPAIHAAATNNTNSSEVSPGESMDVTGAGFAASTSVTVKLDGTPLTTNPTNPSTDANGTVYWGWAQITIPAGTTAGTHTLTMSDGTNSASQQITVFAPTISVTPTSGSPQPDYGSGTGLNVSGTGWPAGDQVAVQIGNQIACYLNADGSGNLSGSPAAGNCQVPRAPAGSETVSAYDNNNSDVATTSATPFTITQAIHVASQNNTNSGTFAQGATVDVSGAGFAASSAVSVYFDGTLQASSPSGRTTDGNGTLYWGWLSFNVPAGTSAGTHTVTLKDAAGNSASQTVTVEQVSVSVTPTTGNPAPDYGSATGLSVLGNGWTPNDQIGVEINGQSVCTLTADGSGNISGSAAANNCTVPRAPAGSESLTATDNSNPGVTQTGSPFTVSAAIHAGDVNNPNSYAEVPGGSMYVTGAGFAASKAITFTFDGTPVSSTPANPTTDTNGTLGWGQAKITIPSTAGPGTHTIVASDGTNVASTTVTLYAPTISVTPTSGNPSPDYGSGTGLTVTGSGWPAGDYIYTEVGGQVICGIYADSSGNLSGSPANCPLPRETAGSQPVLAYDTGQGNVQATGSSFTVTPVLHAGDLNDPYTTADEAPGATIGLSGAGFAGSSGLTFTFDGNSLASTPANPSTGSDGSFGWNSVQVTIPANATTGSHTITATDGSGNHASVTIQVQQPPVAVSPTTGHPSPDYGSATGLTVSGSGWTAGDYIVVQIGGQTVCGLTANASGSISGSQQNNSCQVPRVPYGTQPLTAYDNANPSGTLQTGAPFTVTAAIHTGDTNNVYSTAESPGATADVSAAGFAANSNLTFTFDGAPITTSGSGTTTDGSGYLYFYSNQLTIPSNATAGQHTITATDASGHSASETISVYTPTLSLTPTAGHPAPDYGTATGVSVSGSGWPAFDQVYVQIDGQQICYVTANGSGHLAGNGQNCTVPRVPAGSQPVTAYDTSDQGVTASGGTFTVQPAIHAGDVNNVNSSVASPGSQMYVGGAGFAATSGLTFTFDGAPMTSNPATPETDSNGYLYIYNNQITIPANATSGQHTITAKDAAGNSATETITVYAPSVAVTPTTGNPAPDYGTPTGLNVSGSGWPAGGYVIVQIDGQTVCGLTANASGNITGTQSINGCSVPRVPYGNQALTAYANSDPSVIANGGTFAVRPSIHIGDLNNANSESEAPGGTMYVSVAGLSASSGLTFKFDGNAMTSTPASQSTDSTGYLYFYYTKLTIPANAPAGQHTITVTDASNHSVSATVNVYTPSLSVTPTLGNPAPDYGTATPLTVSGSGWPSGEYVIVQIGGVTVCGITANASGSIYGTAQSNSCQVPRVPYGNQPLTAFANSDPGVSLSAGTFSVQPAIHVGDVNNANRQSETPGAKVYVGAAGFTASSPLTFTFDGTTSLTPSGNATTDTTGYLYVYTNQLTIPSNATAGLHTITATDGAGHSASETIQVYTPTIVVTPTSGAPGTGLSVSGTDWPVGEYVIVQIGGQTVCGVSVDASGKISGDQPHNSCQVPNVASGSQPLTAYDNSQPQDMTATGPNFTVN